MEALTILEALFSEKWILAGVGFWLYWQERAERREAVKQWREERDQITQRITKLAEALRELKR